MNRLNGLGQSQQINYAISNLENELRQMRGDDPRRAAFEAQLAALYQQQQAAADEVKLSDVTGGVRDVFSTAEAGARATQAAGFSIADLVGLGPKHPQQYGQYGAPPVARKASPLPLILALGGGAILLFLLFQNMNKSNPPKRRRKLLRRLNPFGGKIAGFPAPLVLGGAAVGGYLLWQRMKPHKLTADASYAKADLAKVQAAMLQPGVMQDPARYASLQAQAAQLAQQVGEGVSGLQAAAYGG